MRGLGFELEILRYRSAERIERRPCRDPLVNIGRAKRSRRPAEYGEYAIEAMLDAEMRRVLGLIAVERKRLGIERKRRKWIEAVPRGQIDVLNAGAVREISRW